MDNNRCHTVGKKQHLSLKFFIFHVSYCCALSCVAVRLLGRPKPTAPCSHPAHDNSGWGRLSVCSVSHSSVCQTCICMWVYAPCESGFFDISNCCIFSFNLSSEWRSFILPLTFRSKTFTLLDSINSGPDSLRLHCKGNLLISLHLSYVSAFLVFTDSHHVLFEKSTE